MPEPAEDPKGLLLRMLPSVDELLRTDEAQELIAARGQKRALVWAREACDMLRAELLSGPRLAEPSEQALLREAVSIMQGLGRAAARLGVKRVINATGVIVHTNLGRSCLSEGAREAIADAAGYCSLEFDLETGKRGSRGIGAERLICELTGAEAALIVNNCAAAAFLVLTALAKGKEVLVSRGELVEIGGDFRVPDVMAQSGAFMREVGTTNRTKLRDYEAAFSNETAMILRVHPSNYRIIGFTETPRLSELSALARRHGAILFEDAGSGALCDLAPLGLGDEPLISRSIVDGADLVAFSGDKLLGGPQAGIIAGKIELVEKLRRHPLYRALRVDKIAYAALEATLDSYLREAQMTEIPTLRMLAESIEDIAARVDRFIETASGIGGIRAQLGIVEGESVVGGGSAPEVRPPTVLISVSVEGAKAEEIESALRGGDPPVVARIANEKVVLDLRTVDASEDAELMNALARL